MGAIGETSNFDATVYQIESGELLSAGSTGLLNKAATNLANRTKFLKDSVDGMLQKVFPVGSLYFNATEDSSPATLFGFGTWSPIGAGRMPLSAGAGYPAGQTGGEATHTLTVDEIPAHTHPTPTTPQAGATTGGLNTGGSYDARTTNTTGSAGGGGGHNNLPPYISVYIWQRVA